MSKRNTLTEERIAELSRMGRVRDTFDKREENKRIADGWNKGDSGIGNCEPVTLTTSGLKTDDRGGTPAQRSANSALARKGDSPAATGSSGPLTQLYPLVTLCRMAKLPEPVPEYRFAPPRRWRADYCWPLHMLILEIEGGLWTGGRHSRGKGAIADLEKYSEAAILGYRVIYATPQELDNGVCLDRVSRALTDRAAA